MHAAKKDEFLKVLDAEYAETFNGLWHYTAELFYSLNAYHAQFGNPDLVARLNKLAPSYFGYLQRNRSRVGLR
jgi:hypothetical protein